MMRRGGPAGARADDSSSVQRASGQTCRIPALSCRIFALTVTPTILHIGIVADWQRLVLPSRTPCLEVDMRRFIYSLLARVGIVLMAACVHTNAAVMDVTEKFAPLCPDGVKVFADTSKIGQPYHEVALLNSKGESGSTSEAGMIKSQRKKAAELGANGIVLGAFQEPKAGTKIVGALFGTGAERKGSALAIYVPGASSRVHRACDGTTNRVP